MAKKVAKAQIKQPITLPESETALPVSFNAVYDGVKRGEISISREQYEGVYLQMLIDNSKGEVSSTLQRLAKGWAAKEYDSNIIETPLKWLFDKYLANKVKDEFLAKVLFQLLLKGVTDAIEALKNWIRSKNESLGDDIEDAISVASTLVESGKVQDFKNEIEGHLIDIQNRNQQDSENKKTSWFRRYILNPIKSIFGI